MTRPSPVSVLLYIILLEAWFGLTWYWFGPLAALAALGLYAAASLYGTDPLA